MKEKKTIIIADDEEHLNKLLTFKLTKDGFDVISFRNGENVAQKAAEIKPDLVILDLMMPIKDGMTTLRELKDNPETADIPTILLSAKSQEEDIEQGIKAGAADYIIKPFSPSELLERINRALI